eukprot:3009854-Rhodomonas_salina.3
MFGRTKETRRIEREGKGDDESDRARSTGGGRGGWPDLRRSWEWKEDAVSTRLSSLKCSASTSVLRSS